MLTSTDRHAYYRAALACLGFVEARRPTKRRFGADADARWKAFRGHLTASDRLDLLLRDANAEWPGAFGARNVFSLAHSAEDEAFGAAWEPLDAVAGEELWRAERGPGASASARGLMQAIASAWGLSLQPVTLPPVDPAERLVVVGPSAVAALAEQFAASPALDWVEQVACVATPPGHRQIALAALAVVDAHKPARVLSSHDVRPDLHAVRVVRSDDAAPEDLAVVAGARG